MAPSLMDVIRVGTRAGVRVIAVLAIALFVHACRAEEGALLAWRETTSGRRGDGARDAAQRALARFLCGWALTYYGFLFNQSCTAIEAYKVVSAKAAEAKGEKPSFADVKYGRARVGSVLVADRAVGNFVEQSLALFPALFAHFYVVGGLRGVRAAWAWLVVRWLYPAAFARGLPWFIFVTVPNYACVFGMYIDLARFAKVITF